MVKKISIMLTIISLGGRIQACFPFLLNILPYLALLLCINYNTVITTKKHNLQIIETQNTATPETYLAAWTSVLERFP